MRDSGRTSRPLAHAVLVDLDDADLVVMDSRWVAAGGLDVDEGEAAGKVAGINPVTRELNEVISVKDTVLYEVDAADPRDEAIQFNSVYSARGMNVLSNFSPRKLLAWDTDTDNGVLALPTIAMTEIHHLLNPLTWTK